MHTFRYTHVHHVGLIGLDSAGLHADNTYVSCMNFSAPPSDRANCSKIWHHNWVHHASEKCVRNDDYGLNLSVHHTVIFSCGSPRSRNAHAATGCILKGDSNQFFQNTVFNKSVAPNATSQGDLCVPVCVLILTRAFIRYPRGMCVCVCVCVCVHVCAYVHICVRVCVCVCVRVCVCFSFVFFFCALPSRCAR